MWYRGVFKTPTALGKSGGRLRPAWLSWISPSELGSRLLQGAQWAPKSLSDVTHDKLFLLAGT